MPVKLYASIPVSYITADLPEGRYLVSAAGLWERRKARFRWEKLNCLDPKKHEIIIDSGGYSFTEYPEEYINQYHHAAMFCGKTLFMQIDRTNDVAFTEAHRTRYTVPIIRAECDDIYGQVDSILNHDFNCDFFAIGGLKKLPYRTAIVRIMEAVNLAQACKIKRIHLLGAGLKIMRILRTLLCYDLPEISCDSGSWNGRFSSRINEFNAIMQANGWTQRETALRHYLPRYREEIES